MWISAVRASRQVPTAPGRAGRVLAASDRWEAAYSLVEGRLYAMEGSNARTGSRESINTSFYVYL